MRAWLSIAVAIVAMGAMSGRLPAAAPASRPASPPASPPAAATQPSYFIIPLVGKLGQEVPAEAFAEALTAADRAAADYIVLLLDSSGGKVEELDRFTRLLSAHRQRLAAALVKQADGTAAVLPYACHWVFVLAGGEGSSARLAAADALAPEQQSVLLQQIRRRLTDACELGERSALPALAMVDREFAYYGDGVGRIAAWARDPGWELMKRNGARLEITPANAVASGYADGVCRNVDEMALKMGISSGWRNAGDQGREIMAQAARQYAEQLARSHYYRQHRQEIERLQNEVRRLQAQLQQAKKDDPRRAELEAQLARTLGILGEHEAKSR